LAPDRLLPSASPSPPQQAPRSRPCLLLPARCRRASKSSTPRRPSSTQPGRQPRMRRRWLKRTRWPKPTRQLCSQLMRDPKRSLHRPVSTRLRRQPKALLQHAGSAPQTWTEWCSSLPPMRLRRHRRQPKRGRRTLPLRRGRRRRLRRQRNSWHQRQRNTRHPRQRSSRRRRQRRLCRRRERTMRELKVPRRCRLQQGVSALPTRTEWLGRLGLPRERRRRLRPSSLAARGGKKELAGLKARAVVTARPGRWAMTAAGSALWMWIGWLRECPRRRWCG
jgi:hypothetical protein